MKKPKILIFDIETSAMQGDSWRRWETNLHHIRKYSGLLSFAYKWLGEDEIVCKTQVHRGEKKLTRLLLSLFNKADVVIAHNGKAFDIKKANAFFAIQNLNPPAPFAVVDTKQAAKTYFNFDSNSLDELAAMFGIGRKLPHPGYSMWLGCERGDKESWDLMEKYNKHDVYLLEEVYKRLRPHIMNHPNLRRILDPKSKDFGCPYCCSEHTEKRGTRATRMGAQQRRVCYDCRGWFLTRIEK
jgi:uncharacterized protein YprB with RNaseH-like and TPR domain